MRGLGGKRPRLSDSEKIEILNLKRSGKSTTEIAELMGRPTTTIYNILRKAFGKKSLATSLGKEPLEDLTVVIFGHHIQPPKLDKALKIAVKINKHRVAINQLMAEMENL